MSTREFKTRESPFLNSVIFASKLIAAGIAFHHLSRMITMDDFWSILHSVWPQAAQPINTAISTDAMHYADLLTGIQNADAITVRKGVREARDEYNEKGGKPHYMVGRKFNGDFGKKRF